jgi:hypothetical protein
MNRQLASLKKLCSQKPLGTIQRDHFNGPHVIEPENFCFVDVGVHNLSIRQNVRFSADSLEAHAMDRSLGEAQLSGETSVDDNRNLALLWKGFQSDYGFARSGHRSVNGHELRSE